MLRINVFVWTDEASDAIVPNDQEGEPRAYEDLLVRESAHSLRRDQQVGKLSQAVMGNGRQSLAISGTRNPHAARNSVSPVDPS